MKRSLLLIAVLALGACHTTNIDVTHEPPDAAVPDAGCAKPCGESCCADPDVCFAGACCTPNCDGKQCGSDGCGGSCGGCDTGFECDAATSQCECVRPTDEQLCEDADKLCGALAVTDRCGEARNVTCDRCAAPQTCHLATGTCSCDAETPAAFCARLDRHCGSVTALDTCGIEQTVDCGGCEPGTLCDATGTCAPCTETREDLCQRVGAVCGELHVTDRCNVARTETCGDCTFPQQCGTDHQCHACVAQSDSAFCAAHQVTCGPLTAANNCGDSVTVESCGDCTLDQRCNAAGACEACTRESETELCLRNNKWCGPATLLDTCGHTRTIAECGPCPGGRICGTDGRCSLGTRPANDDCTTPDILVFDANGHAQAQGDTTTATNAAHSDYPCYAGVGNDVVYKAHLPQVMDLSVTLTAAYSGDARPTIMYVRTACDQQASQLQAGCRTGSAPGSSTLSFESLPAGDYFVWVDAPNAASFGPFAFEAQRTVSPPGPANDLCVAAEALQFVGDVASVNGTTRRAAREGTGSCAAMTGPDVYYSFTLGRASSVFAVVENAASTPEYAPAVYIVDACGAGAVEKACGGNHAPQGSALKGATASAGALPPGTYYVVVGGVDGAGMYDTAVNVGDFRLVVTTGSPIANDGCAAPYAPQALAVDPVTGTVTVQGDTSNATNNSDTNCANNTGRDVVFSYDVPSGGLKDVRVEVVPARGSQLWPSVEVRTSCPDVFSSKRCKSTSVMATDHNVSLDLLRQSAGTYFVWVDGTDASHNGAFTLKLTLVDPPPAPPNDVCVAGSRITIDPATSPTATLSGSSRGAFNDSTGSCAAMDGGDVAYTFSLTQPAHVLARVTSTGSPAFRPSLYLRSGCPGSGTELACGGPIQPALGTDYSASLVAPALPTGNYVLIVDGTDATEGDFTLELTASDPMDNDSCANARAIQLDTTGHAIIHGDTTALANDSAPGTACADTGAGPDAVYTLTVPSPKNVRFSLTTAASSDPYDTTLLYVRTDCGTRSAELRCAANAQAASSAFTLPWLMPGVTYYVWVDSNYASRFGAFTLEVSATDPAPPANDTCASATVLPISATNPDTVTVTGSTWDAADDLLGSCAADATGGADVIYRFTLAQPRQVQIDVVPTAGSTLEPVVALQAATCGTGTELACSRFLQATAKTSVLAPMLAAGDYFVVVDGAAPLQNGPFDLTLTTTPIPAAPANDTCAGAISLGSSAGGNLGATGSTRAARDDYAGRCSGPAGHHRGPDVAYSFTMSEGKRVAITVTPATAGGSFVPAVYVQTACGSPLPADTVACASASSPGPVTAAITYLPAGGPYYIVVDGVAGTLGDFSLAVDFFAPVAGDSCANAIPLTLTPGTTTHLSGTTLDAVNDDDGPFACADQDPAAGGDVVYRISTVGLGKQKLTATITSYPNIYYPSLAIRSTCARTTAADELGCRGQLSQAPILMDNVILEEGTYYLWVDSRYPSASAGAFQLDVALVSWLPPPPNDLCRGAFPLGTLPAAGTVSQVGSTLWATDDYAALHCGDKAADGADVAYAFTLAQPSQVTATVRRRASSPTFAPVLSLRTATCTSTALGDQFACAAAPDATVGTVMIKQFALAAGTYHLLVDGVDASRGDFALDVTTAPVRVLADTCAQAVPLVFDARGHATLHDDNTDAQSDFNHVSCATSNYAGPDLVYVVDTTAMGTRDFYAKLLLPTGVSGSAMALRSSCWDETTEAACKYQSGLTNTMGATGLAPGVYYLWVKSLYATTKFAFDLAVDLVPPATTAPANSTCAGAEPLVFDAVSGEARAVGVTAGTTSAMSGSCATMNGPEAIYSFTPSADRSIYVVASRIAPLSSSFEPNLHLRTQCPSDGATSEVACSKQASGVATLSANVTAGTTYYLVVDGTNTTAGRFELFVASFTPPTNDGCASTPQELAFDATGSARLRTTNLFATDDTYTNACMSQYTGGRDLVFTVTVPAGRDKDLSVDLAPLQNSAFRGVMYLRSACADRPSELGCTLTASANVVLSWKWPRLAPGTYYLWVDSYRSSNTSTTYYDGPFDVRAKLIDSAAALAGDSCTGPTRLSLDASASALVTGEAIEAGVNDATPNIGACGSSTIAAPGRVGPDRVYEVVSAGGKMIAKVTPSNSGYGVPAWAPSVYIRSACAGLVDADQLACATTTSSNTAVTATATGLAAGTYYVWVDAASTANWGTFTLDLAQTPPNDTCAGAISLTLGAPATAGNTTAAVKDYPIAGDNWSTTCSNATSDRPTAPDVVFSYTALDSTPFAVRMTSAVSWYPIVWISTGTCGSAAACTTMVSAPSGPTKTITVAAPTPGTTYYVVVSGTFSSTVGPFTIWVEQ